MTRWVVFLSNVLALWILDSLPGVFFRRNLEKVAFAAVQMNAEDIQQRSSWAKGAYARAETRLKQAKIGMSTSEFYTLVQLKTLRRGSGGPILAVIADGWIMPANYTWVSGQTEVNEYIFGYLEESVLIKKAVVRFENKKLVALRFLASKGISELSPEEQANVTARDVDALYTPEAYQKAAERAKKLRIGMDTHEFENTMNLIPHLSRDGDFYLVGEGLLNELGEQAKHDTKGPHKWKKIYFGYRQNNKPFPKLAIEFEDGRISLINSVQ